MFILGAPFKNVAGANKVASECRKGSLFGEIA